MLNIVRRTIRFKHRDIEFILGSHFQNRFMLRVSKTSDMVKFCQNALETFYCIFDEDKAARALNRFQNSTKTLYSPSQKILIPLALEKWQNQYSMFKTVYSKDEEHTQLPWFERWDRETPIKTNFFGEVQASPSLGSGSGASSQFVGNTASGILSSPPIHAIAKK